jgi:hypothetical protein
MLTFSAPQEQAAKTTKRQFMHEQTALSTLKYKHLLWAMPQNRKFIPDKSGVCPSGKI